MRSCYKNKLSYLAATIFVALFTVTGCTKVDDNVGNGLIPGGDDHLTLHIDTLGLKAEETIKVFQTYSDSIGLKSYIRKKRGAMNLNVGYIGSAVDPKFGKTSTASIFTGLPGVPVSPHFYKNRKNSIDSVKLTLNMKYVSGDADVRQTFNVYKLNDSLAYAMDTIYYQSFHYENHIDDAPLFSFEYSGKPTDIETVKLNVLANGQKMLDELLAADTTLFYSKKEYEFLRKFKGFVIAPALGNPEHAAIYANYLPNSYLNFYSQRERDKWEIDYDDDDHKDKEVTVYTQLYLSDSDPLKNTSIASIRHDFSGTPLDGVQNGEIEAPHVAYVKGLGGVTATLEFPEGFFEALEALKPSEEYALFINQAQMYVWMEEQTPEAYDNAFVKLGSYIDYSKLSVIADYYISDKPETMVVPYDGTLNRNPGKGFYKMDISSFLQHALENPEDKKNRRFTLGGTYTPYEPFIDKSTALQSHGSENPIRVRITYTLIKPTDR